MKKLKNAFENNIFNLYRDVLAVIKDLPGPQIERLKKNFIKTFKDCDLPLPDSRMGALEPPSYGTIIHGLLPY